MNFNSMIQNQEIEIILWILRVEDGRGSGRIGRVIIITTCSQVFNPPVDFSVDFLGNLDPNCSLKSDVEDMLQIGVNVQDHKSISSFYKNRNDENEDIGAQSLRHFPTVNVNSMIDKAETTSVKRRDKWELNIFCSWREEKIILEEIESPIPELKDFSIAAINDHLSKFILKCGKKTELFIHEQVWLSWL